MSPSNTRVTDAHFDYITARTRAEDPFLRDLRHAAVEAGMPAISIGPAQASFLQILLKLQGATDVLEVGTLGGYSAIAMARALPADRGRVRTVEVSAEHAAFAREWIGRSDVAGRVEVIVGSGRDVLPGLDDGGADAVFLDADKPSYPFYAEQALRILRPRGMLLADNALAFGHLLDDADQSENVVAIRSFNDLMPRLPGLHPLLVPIGDGCWVGVKEAGTPRPAP